VFVPCAFISGIIGQFFRQFALTIAISTVISAFNSLTLSPALAVLLLKPKSQGHGEALPRLGVGLMGAWLGWEFMTPWVAPYVSSWPWDRLHLSPATAVPGFAALLGFVLGLLLAWPVNFALGLIFRSFNRVFNLITSAYVGTVAVALRGSVLVLAVY